MRSESIEESWKQQRCRMLGDTSQVRKKTHIVYNGLAQREQYHSTGNGIPIVHQIQEEEDERLYAIAERVPMCEKSLLISSGEVIQKIEKRERCRTINTEPSISSTNNNKSNMDDIRGEEHSDKRDTKTQSEECNLVMESSGVGNKVVNDTTLEHRVECVTAESELSMNSDVSEMRDEEMYTHFVSKDEINVNAPTNHFEQKEGTIFRDTDISKGDDNDSNVNQISGNKHSDESDSIGNTYPIQHIKKKSYDSDTNNSDKEYLHRPRICNDEEGKHFYNKNVSVEIDSGSCEICLIGADAATSGGITLHNRVGVDDSSQANKGGGISGLELLPNVPDIQESDHVRSIQRVGRSSYHFSGDDDVYTISEGDDCYSNETFDTSSKFNGDCSM